MSGDKEHICGCHHHHDEKQKHVISEIPSDEELIDLADFFKVFGDKTRVKILYELMTEELCVCDIAELMKMEQSAISHQLKILKQAKLVNNRRDGKTIYYSLADDHIYSILSQGHDHINE